MSPAQQEESSIIPEECVLGAGIPNDQRETAIRALLRRELFDGSILELGSRFDPECRFNPQSGVIGLGRPKISKFMKLFPAAAFNGEESSVQPVEQDIGAHSAAQYADELEVARSGKARETVNEGASTSERSANDERFDLATILQFTRALDEHDELIKKA